jgi:hypothetical protein
VGEETAVLIVVTSARNHFKQRARTRATWATADDPRARTVFSIGRTGCPIPADLRELTVDAANPLLTKPLGCEWRQGLETADQRDADPAVASAVAARRAQLDAEQAQLDREMAQFGDLLLVDVMDTYRNLCRKKLAAFAWVAAHTRVPFVLKTDDADCIVGVGNLLRAIANMTAEEQGYDKAQPLLWANMWKNHQVQRTGKYQVRSSLGQQPVTWQRTEGLQKLLVPTTLTTGSSIPGTSQHSLT